MVGKELRDYNEQEANAFKMLKESQKCKTDALFEAIADKMFRHEYCLVQHDLVEEVLNLFKECGLNVRIKNNSHWLQTEIELV